MIKMFTQDKTNHTIELDQELHEKTKRISIATGQLEELIFHKMEDLDHLLYDWLPEDIIKATSGYFNTNEEYFRFTEHGLESYPKLKMYGILVKNREKIERYYNTI